MNPLFENETCRNEAAIKEVYKYWFFKRPLMVGIYLILGVYLLSGILGFVFDPESAREFIFPFVCIVFVTVLMIVGYFNQVKLLVSRDKERANGGDFICTVRISDSEIEQTAFDSKVNLPIEKVKYVLSTKNYFALVTEARHMFILKKDSFAVGDSIGFIAFLKEKGIKIKGKKN